VEGLLPLSSEDTDLRTKIRPRIRSYLEAYMKGRGYRGSIDVVDTDEGFDVYVRSDTRRFLDSIRIVVKPLKVGDDYLLRSPVDYTKMFRKLDEIFMG